MRPPYDSASGFAGEVLEEGFFVGGIAFPDALAQAGGAGVEGPRILAEDDSDGIV